jgi:hypothetical protein
MIKKKVREKTIIKITLCKPGVLHSHIGNFASLCDEELWGLVSILNRMSAILTHTLLTDNAKETPDMAEDDIENIEPPQKTDNLEKTLRGYV